MLASIDLDRLIADTEQEMLGVLERHEDERTRELYEMVPYHMGLDSDAPRGKRMRPLIGLLAYQSIAGDHAKALPGAAAVEMGHNFSLVHDDIEDNGTERRHRPAPGTAGPAPRGRSRASSSAPFARRGTACRGPESSRNSWRKAQARNAPAGPCRDPCGARPTLRIRVLDPAPEDG